MHNVVVEPKDLGEGGGGPDRGWQDHFHLT